MEQILKDTLCSLKSAGSNGFEGLITDLLTSITGQKFLLAKSGFQGGKDLQSNNIYIECKKYCNDTPPKQILEKIAQANQDNPNLDLWLLVTTTDISSQDDKSYKDECDSKGVSYSNLFAASNQKYLEALCIIEKKCFIEFLDVKAEFKNSDSIDIESIKEYFKKNGHDYIKEKEVIQNTFLPASIGFCSFKYTTQSYFSNALKSVPSSMTRLKQKINIKEESTLFTNRESVNVLLDKWYKNWSKTKKIALVNGEEGNGKSWAVAKWLSTIVEKDNAPPVMFLNSSDCSSKDLSELLAIQIKKSSSSNKTHHFWEQKVIKWFKSKSDGPRLILVIDGINENHDSNWWRQFLINFQSSYKESISLIVTTREHYWQKYFKNDEYLNCEQLKINGFNDKELIESLNQISRKISEFPPKLVPWLRKPRYFQLVSDLLPELKNNPEAISPERLCYEDIKKRWSNKIIKPIANGDFENLIVGLADAYSKNKTTFTRREINSEIEQGVNSDHQSIIEELSNTDFLKSNGRLYELSRAHLSVGLGILLCDQINSSIKGEDNFDDVHGLVSGWLEPKTGMDVQSNVLGAAFIHSFSNPEYSHNLKIALLYEWSITHNRFESDRENFISNFFVVPDIYSEVAEKLIENDFLSDEMDTLFTYAMTKHSDSRYEIDALKKILSRWLSFVHADGYPFNRGQDNKKLKKNNEYIESNLKEIKRDPAIYEEYKPIIINNDHLLRLDLIAFAVISYSSISDYIHSIVQACISEFIMYGYSEHNEKMSWLLRSSEENVSDTVISECKKLIESDVLCLKKAGYSLLMRLGDLEAVKLVDQMPSNRFPIVNHQHIENEKRDPCNSGFTWRKEQAIDCLKNPSNITKFSFKIIRDMANFCNDPDFKIPKIFDQQILNELGKIKTENIWSDEYRSTEQHSFEDMKILIARVSPIALEDIYRKLCKELETRTDISFRLLSIYIHRFNLLLSEKEVASIKIGWDRVTKQLFEKAEDSNLGHMERSLFTSLLPYYDASAQLKLIEERSKKICPSYDEEMYFKTCSSTKPKVAILSKSDADNTILTKLSFLTIQKSITNDDKKIILSLINDENEFIRFHSLRLIDKSKDNELVKGFIRSGWRSKDFLESNVNEQIVGSKILAEYGTEIPFDTLVQRIHFSYLGYAIKQRGYVRKEINQYALVLDSVFSNLGLNIQDLKNQLSGLTFYFNDLGELSEQLSMNLPSNLFQQELFESNDKNINQKFPKGYLFDDQSNEKQNEVIDYYENTIRKYVEEGSDWFHLKFDPSSIDIIIKENRALVNNWVSELCDNSSKLFHGRSFAVALCEKLLILGEEDGIRLYKTLYNNNHGFHVIKSKWLEINDFDIALLRGKINSNIESVIKERFSLCESDKDLMSLCVGFQLFEKTSWLFDFAVSLLGSEISKDIALGLTILGFIDSEEAKKELLKYIEEYKDVNTWTKIVSEKSYSTWEKNNWAKHWFNIYIENENNTDAWAAFTLFLGCVDCRYIIWKNDAIQKMKNRDGSKERISYIEVNRNELGQARDKNIKDLKETLLYQKISNKSLSPWLLLRQFTFV